MLQIIEPQPGAKVSLETYAEDARFSALVRDLREEAKIKAGARRGAVWMVNSTAQGGGVAEMLPTEVTLLRELGIETHWAVIGTNRPQFFQLTKRLHNLIHGNASAGVDLGPEDAELLEAVGRANAEELAPLLGPDDVVVVHDPQPVTVGWTLRERGVRCIWRCHIGVDTRNEATRAVWRFLRPYLRAYNHVAFSAPEYVPSYLAEHASVLHPGIDPSSHKNRELSVPKTVGILCNAGLQTAHEPVPTDAFANPVLRVQSNGRLAPPGEIGLLFRPIVLQVSRWDRLKGFLPLLHAFALLKRRLWKGELSIHSERNRRRVELARLVLAGPDPRGIADDPEGAEVFDEVARNYVELEPPLQTDVAVMLLPMHSRKENALIVNAMQRCATLIVQNSLREGFGLTVTEAMWKRQAVLGSIAVGIRQQIRDGIDGLLAGDPSDPEDVSAHLLELLTNAGRRYAMGRSAQRRVYSSFLVFTVLSRYLELLETVRAGGTLARPSGVGA